MIIVFSVLVLSVILFITEKLPVDFVAIASEILLILIGILNMDDGFSGFT